MTSLFRLRLTADASLLLAPVLAWQGRRVRRTVPALPDAAGPTTGACGTARTHAHDDASLDLLVIGESTAAGMGALTHEGALAGCTARALSRQAARPVRWCVLGRSGATAREARGLLADETLIVSRADVAIIALGVNDVLRFRRDRTWTRDLDALRATLRARCGDDVRVVLAAVPPLHRFPALPQPLRWALGARARLLDAAAARWAARTAGVVHVPASALLAVADRGLFAADGFHPSPEGYRVWGDSLGAAAAGLVRRARGEAASPAA